MGVYSYLIKKYDYSNDKEFNTSKNLYYSVKNKMTNEDNQEKRITIDNKKLGKQGGWESGRSQNLN